LREGFGSLYAYCRAVLRLSEWEAYNRIEVARTARRFPVILDLLAQGTVNLTTIRLLAPHLTADNHRAVLESARDKDKEEVREIVAALSPRPDVAFSIRPIPAAELPSMTAPAVSTTSAASVTAAASSVAVGAAAQVMPLSPDRYKLQVTIGGETVEKLRLATDMLGHAVPSGDQALILDRALSALLVELAKKKFAATAHPRRSRGVKPGARQPAAAVQRAVWVRDLGRCKFIAANGRRCNERRFLEFHHVDPYALGGEATVDKIELRCRSHNDYEGRLYFGKRRRRGELVPEQVGVSTP
jgi:hypothetical protein